MAPIEITPTPGAPDIRYTDSSVIGSTVADSQRSSTASVISVLGPAVLPGSRISSISSRVAGMIRSNSPLQILSFTLRSH